jgi:hypothetical protein
LPEAITDDDMLIEYVDAFTLLKTVIQGKNSMRQSWSDAVEIHIRSFI